MKWALAAGLTPLVGRAEELEFLQQRWEQAKVREGQVVLLSGEPGIGKSRLVQELKEQVAKAGEARREFRCSSYARNTAFYSVIDHLQRWLQFQGDEPEEEKFRRLETALEGYRRLPQESVALFASLLALALPERYAPLKPSPEQQRQKTQEALVTWLAEESEEPASPHYLGGPALGLILRRLILCRCSSSGPPRSISSYSWSFVHRNLFLRGPLGPLCTF